MRWCIRFAAEMLLSKFLIKNLGPGFRINVLVMKSLRRLLQGPEAFVTQEM